MERFDDCEAIDLKTEGNTWHQRLLAGEPTAPSRIVEAAFRQIGGSLRAKYSSSPHNHLVEDAVSQAMTDYLHNAERFKPQLASLHTYLYRAAERDFWNLCKTEERQQPPVNRIIEIDDPNLPSSAEPADPDVDVEELVGIQMSQVHTELEALFPKEQDRIMAYMILDKVRKTEQFAEVLGITHLPLAEQKACVKRNKDRLKIAMRRHFVETELRHE